jgi:cytochrome P450
VAAFGRYQRRAARALVLRFLHLPRRWVQRWLRRDAAVIRSWMEAVIEQRLTAPDSGGDDLLACLIEAVDPQTGHRLTAQELVDQVCFLFLAGHETSASGLSSACWLLALDQAVQQRLQQEVDALPQPLTPVALRQMPYGAAVFQETLRLYPPVSFFIRERQGEATTLMASDAAPSRCPVGSLLTLSPWVIHRHEQHWPQPHQFRPERFLLGEASADERQCSREAWLPYGMGPRKCPGAAFAQQEALLVLAELLRCYQLLPAPGLPSPEWVGRLTLRSASGVWLRLVARQSLPVD